MQLAALGADVHLAVLDNAGRGDDEIFKVVGSKAAGCHRLPCDRQFDLKTLWALRDCIVSQGIDVVHSHSYKTTFYAGLLKPFLGFGLVSTYHNWLMHTRALRVYAWIDKKLARFNDFAVGVSTPVVSALRSHVRAPRLAQIDNGIDVARYGLISPSARADARQALGFDPQVPLLGFVGRLSPEKGLHFLLPALKAPALDSVHLLVVGDGPERAAVEAQIAELGLGARVHMLGYRRDTDRLYAALDAFVLPSTLEAFPMVLLEAMSSGLPVVASAVGEIPRIIERPAFGWLTPAGDSAALAQAIEQAMFSPAEQRRQIGEAARQRVVNEFSSEAMARRYLAIYESITRR